MGRMFPSLLCFSRPQTSNCTGPPPSLEHNRLSTVGKRLPGRPGHAPHGSEGTVQAGNQSRQRTGKCLERGRLREGPQRSSTAQTPFSAPTVPGARRPLQTRILHPSGEAGMCSNQPWLLSQLDPAPFSPTHGPWDTMTKYLGTRCAVPPSPACQRTGRVCHRGVKQYQMLPARWYGTKAPTRLRGGGWSQGRRVPTQTHSLHPRTCTRTPRACPDEPVPPAVPRRGNICTLHALQRRGQNSSVPSSRSPEHFSYFSLCQGHKKRESDACGDQVQKSRLSGGKTTVKPNHKSPRGRARRAGPVPSAPTASVTALHRGFLPQKAASRAKLQLQQHKTLAVRSQRAMNTPRVPVQTSDSTHGVWAPRAPPQHGGWVFTGSLVAKSHKNTGQPG